MYIRVIEDTQTFASLREPWNDLVGRSRHPDIFLTHEWLFTWWEVYGRGKQLHILLCFDHANQLAGILPAYIKTRAAFPGVRAVRLLGSEAVTTDFLTCIAAPGSEHRVYEALVIHLFSGWRKWSAVELANVEAGTPFYEHLENRCRPLCRTSFQASPVKCPFVSLPGDWKTFLQSLSFKARKKTRYYRNALAKRGPVALHTVSDIHSLGEALRDAMTLHRNSMSRKGWRERFSSGRYRDFYRKACERLFALGRLRLSFLQVGGRRVAFLNSFRYREKLYAYHTGFDASWGDSSVGFVLLGLVIESAIREGCTRFEFLRGDQKYKYEWAITGEREIADIVLYNNSPSGRLYLLACSARDGAKKMLKQCIPGESRA